MKPLRYLGLFGYALFVVNDKEGHYPSLLLKQ